MLARRTSLPPTLLAPPRVGAGWPERTVAREAVMIAGVLWQVGPSAPVEGSAIVGDAYVRIQAPDRPSFGRVAAGLRRVDR